MDIPFHLLVTAMVYVLFIPTVKTINKNFSVSLFLPLSCNPKVYFQVAMARNAEENAQTLMEEYNVTFSIPIFDSCSLVATLSSLQDAMNDDSVTGIVGPGAQVKLAFITQLY